MYEIIERLAAFQIVLEIIRVILGAGLCFSALKWRRGTLTSTAIMWGALLGLWLGLTAATSFDADMGDILLCIVLGALIFPILTYTVAGVNRFVLGFVFGTKFIGMLTTALLKEGMIEVMTALLFPFIAGAVIGLVLMAWTRMRVLPVVICCTFIGAGEIAPIISEWASRIKYTFSGDIADLIDPLDLIFALFKIELTDTVTFLAMLILLVTGCYFQIKRLKEQGIDLSTPVIGFEIDGDTEK